MKVDPTPEQSKIINETSGHFSVLASAGSGKTYVVTERYLKLIEERLATPSQILAITFTRKAAAEMKRRIVDRLRNAGRYEEAQEAETGPIQTIHSFCERILRENSIACGLDPKFEIIGTGESSRLRKYAIQKAITLSEIEDEDASFFLQVMVGQRDRNSLGSYSLIENSIESLMDQFRSSDYSREFFISLYSSSSEYISKTHQLLMDSLPEVVRAEMNSEFGKWDDVARTILRRNKMLSKVPWVKNAIAEPAEERGAKLVCGLARLALGAWSIYESSLRDVQMLDFNQLERKAVNALENNPYVRKRLEEQYSYVMVDEAQDLNPIQFRIFHSLQSSSKVLIGDHKQSIYLFRQADVKRFQDVSKQDFRLLSKNFRSSVPIQNFVDQVFGPVFGEDYAPMRPDRDENDHDYRDVEIWRLSAKKYWRELAKHISNTRFEGSTAILAKSNSTVGQLESALRLAGVGTRTMGGRADFYANLEIRDLVNVLISLVNPSDDYALLATLRSPIVGLTLDSILLLSQKDGGARASLYQFEPPFTEDQIKLEQFCSWFQPMSLTADRYAAWEIISQILAQSQLLPNLAKRHDAYRKILNVRKLLVIASQTPDSSVVEFAQMLREIRSLKHQEGDAPLDDDHEDLIIIGTVHRAKGLEWDNVIIADGMDYGTRRKTAPLLDPQTGWVGFSKKTNITYASQYIQEKQFLEDLDEVKRLEYVALTRAKKKLIVVSWEDGSKYLLKEIRAGLGTEQFEKLRTVELGSNE
jgi:ATP-dependent helicase/nuclease subunit A